MCCTVLTILQLCRSDPQQQEFTLNKFLICQFRPGERGPYCEQPIGQGPGFGRVYPDKKNTIPIQIGMTYLCRVKHVSKQKSHFVVIEKSIQDLLKEFTPHLCVADWKKGRHATDDIKAELTIHFVKVSAAWYQSAGRHPVKFLTLRYTFEGEEISFSIAESEAREEINLVEKRVRKCTGPVIAVGAVISRQSDSRQSAWR